MMKRATLWRAGVVVGVGVAIALTGPAFADGVGGPAGSSYKNHGPNSGGYELQCGADETVVDATGTAEYNGPNGTEVCQPGNVVQGRVQASSGSVAVDTVTPENLVSFSVGQIARIEGSPSGVGVTTTRNYPDPPGWNGTSTSVDSSGVTVRAGGGGTFWGPSGGGWDENAGAAVRPGGLTGVWFIGRPGGYGGGRTNCSVSVTQAGAGTPQYDIKTGTDEVSGQEDPTCLLTAVESLIFDNA
jgi:hypothetical protein